MIENPENKASRLEVEQLRCPTKVEQLRCPTKVEQPSFQKKIAKSNCSSIFVEVKTDDDTVINIDIVR